MEVGFTELIFYLSSYLCWPPYWTFWIKVPSSNAILWLIFPTCIRFGAAIRIFNIRISKAYPVVNRQVCKGNWVNRISNAYLDRAVRDQSVLLTTCAIHGINRYVSELKNNRLNICRSDNNDGGVKSNVVDDFFCWTVIGTCRCRCGETHRQNRN